MKPLLKQLIFGIIFCAIGIGILATEWQDKIVMFITGGLCYAIGALSLLEASKNLAETFIVVNFQKYIEAHDKWALSVFGKRNAKSPLTHLQEEVKELLEKPTDLTEFADCFVLLLDALSLQGYTLNQLEKAMYDKLEVNKKRSWYPVGSGDSMHWKHIIVEGSDGQQCIIEHGTTDAEQIKRERAAWAYRKTLSKEEQERLVENYRKDNDFNRGFLEWIYLHMPCAECPSMLIIESKECQACSKINWK